MKRWRWILSLLVLGTSAYFFYMHLPYFIDQLSSWGVFTLWGFLLLYCLTSILCLPTVLVVLSGGVLFGPVLGTVLNLVGATLGAACNFCIVRYAKSAQSVAVKNKRIQRILHQVDQWDWKAVALLRLAPAIPYNLVNYGLGLTSIKLSHYLLATFIFLIPNKIIVTCCGYYGVHISYL